MEINLAFFLYIGLTKSLVLADADAMNSSVYVDIPFIFLFQTLVLLHPKTNFCHSLSQRKHKIKV